MNGHLPGAPQPVPELGHAPAASAVTDEERNAFGRLLDTAAEQGLLSPADYQERLGQVAEAGSVAELQRIVTEIPAFGGDPAPSAAGGHADVDALLWAERTQAVARRERGNPWLVLVLVVAVLLVSLVALGLVAAHVIHTHASVGSPAFGGRLSSLRL